jgi:cytochrome d ubiquinol oxidase subunit I
MASMVRLLVLVALFGAWLHWKRPPLLAHPSFLKLLVISGPLGFGWMVTELGRQPWIIHGLMRTKDAVSPMPHLIVPFLFMTGTYLLSGIIVILLFKGHIVATPTQAELQAVARKNSDPL